MKVFRYENSHDEVNNATGPVIFLAGPTVRGHQTHLRPSWRFEAIELFEKSEFEGSLIVPEFISLTESDKSKTWIPLWEYNGLKRADTILFWIPRTKELIGLTTNWEHGYWFARSPDRVVYGRPDECYRNGYLDIMYTEILREEGQEAIIHTSLLDTVEAAIMNSHVNSAL